QTHREKVDVATPGRRLAVNVVGWDVPEIQRGDLLCHPATYSPSHLLDVMLHVLPDAPKAIKHNLEIEFFSGAAQRVGHIRLIGVETLAPGEEGSAQLRLEAPVALAGGDRFIIRQASPSRTLGGGQVLDPTPRGRWRRFHTDTLDRFRMLSEGSLTDLVAQKVAALEPTTAKEILAAVP